MWTVVIEFIIQLRPSSTKGHKPHCDFLCVPAQPSEVTHISKGGVFTQPQSVWCARCSPRYHQQGKAVADVMARDREGPPPGHSPHTFFIQKPRRLLLVLHYVLATRARPSTLRPCCCRSAYGSSKFTGWPLLRHCHGQENSTI